MPLMKPNPKRKHICDSCKIKPILAKKCKQCLEISHRSYRDKNKARISAREKINTKRYIEKNWATVAFRESKYRNENKDKQKIRNRRSYLKNKEKYVLKANKWRSENIDYVNYLRREDYKKNIEKYRKIVRDFSLKKRYGLFAQAKRISLETKRKMEEIKGEKIRFYSK